MQRFMSWPFCAGAFAATSALTLRELSVQHATLEETYMQLTGDVVDYRTADHTAAPAAN